MGFALIHLHGEVHGVKAKLDGLVSPREATGVGWVGHGTAVARVCSRIGITRRLVALGLLFSSHLAFDVSLDEAKLVGVLVLPLSAGCGWNSSAMVVFCPWRVRAVLV